MHQTKRALAALLAAACFGFACADVAPHVGAAPAPARWWKGNLHTHSLWSDGNDFPEMIAAWYRDHGYHFLALSDHNILSDHEKWIDNDDVIRRGGRQALARYRARFGEEWVETRGAGGEVQVRLKTLRELRALLEEPDRFLMVQGEEISDKLGELPIHLNASNLEQRIAPQGGATVREVIRNNLRAIDAQARAVGRPILGHLNHPNFGWAVTAEDLAHVVEERFFEIFNGHPAVNQLGDAQHASVERLWDVANTIRIAALGAPLLYGLATDDSHNYFGTHGASPGRGWVMVRASALDPSALIDAIQRGDFYASSGVELEDIAFDPARGELRLRIAAREGVHYTTRFVGTRRRQAKPPTTLDLDEPVAATSGHADEIGAVLAEVEGIEPRYVLQGDELYVRAVITSSEPALNPAYEGAMQQAWVQPVGWRRWLDPRAE